MTSQFGLLKAAALFVTVFFVLQLAYSADSLEGARAFVVADVVVRPAAALINLVDPHAAAWPEGERLRSPAGGVRILQGCEGIEVMFLLAAAMACAPLALRHRMTGTLIGIAVVFVLSQLRVLGLFYAHRAGPQWFDAIHGTVAPLATLAGALAFFLWWLSRKAAPPLSAA